MRTQTHPRNGHAVASARTRERARTRVRTHTTTQPHTQPHTHTHTHPYTYTYTYTYTHLIHKQRRDLWMPAVHVFIFISCVGRDVVVEEYFLQNALKYYGHALKYYGQHTNTHTHTQMQTRSASSGLHAVSNSSNQSRTFWLRIVVRNVVTEQRISRPSTMVEGLT